MRFETLLVEHFKAIARAELRFAPGLNVLHGPNDLGKSTLGVALRAVLLLPSNSVTADDYRSWRSEEKPHVALTFTDDTQRWWRVSKRFTEKRQGLSFSKDGSEFALDVSDRQVDEKIRAMLGWGIASPGGNNAPKGMPQSFLANALLAGQSDSTAVLAASLENDGIDSGRLKLTQALSALAEDPMVRHVLDAAEREVNQFFTKTGKRKRGAGAKLPAASDAVKALQDELMHERQLLADAVELENETTRLQSVWVEAEHAVEAAQAELTTLRALSLRAAEREAVLQALDSERRAVAAHLELVDRHQTLSTVIRDAIDSVARLAERVTEARTSLRARERALRDAEVALRNASSADGEAERALARANLNQQQSALEVERASLVQQLEQATASSQLRELISSRDALQARLPALTKSTEEATQTAQLAEAIIHYGEWRASKDSVTQAETWRAEAIAFRETARARLTEAHAEETRARQLEAQLTQSRSSLPDEKKREALSRLRREMDLAEAALGGGVTVVLRPRSPLRLRSVTDENEPEDEKVSREVTLEADRRVQLTIGDLAELEITAGAADKRSDAQHLKKRWKTESTAIFDAAEVRSLEELDAKFDALEEKGASLIASRTRVQELKREADAAKERAQALEDRAGGTPTAAQLEAKRALVGALDFEMLAAHFDAMGSSWESQARPLLARSQDAARKASAELARIEGELQVAKARVADLEARGARSEGPSVSTVQKAIDALKGRESTLGAQLKSLDAQGNAKVAQAKKALEASRAEFARAEAALDEAQIDHAAEQQALATANGEAKALHGQLAKSDGDALKERLEAAERRADAWKNVGRVDTSTVEAKEREVQALRATGDAARDAYRQSEAVLGMTGGPQARERVRELEESLVVARAEERHLEVDAEAWRLLVETIHAAEKEDSSGLGLALAQPVTAQFNALTRGRYPQVSFDASLRTAGVALPGTQASPDDVLAGLSVGTRDHLATLVRMAIAVQLKSPLVLDDHLVHSDVARMEWFQEALEKAAEQTQIIVLTCRPQDYPGGTRQDLEQVIERL